MREQQYGTYLLLDRIAVGGMAEIFLARQMGVEGFEKTVVLKRIRPHLGDKKSFVRMFLNEAKLAAQLNHPNIIQIHDLGKVGDSYFIAMEYLFGRDMRRVIPKAEQQGIAFPIVYACKIASQALEGLYYAHQKADLQGQPLGIVHHEWVTGFKLFTGESDVAVLKSITDGKIYRPSYFKAEVPEAVEIILMRALEKDSSVRYQNAW